MSVKQGIAGYCAETAGESEIECEFLSDKFTFICDCLYPVSLFFFVFFIACFRIRYFLWPLS